MFQYPRPPLSISSPKLSIFVGKDNSDSHLFNDTHQHPPSPPRISFNSKRFQKDSIPSRPAFAPLSSAISTNAPPVLPRSPPLPVGPPSKTTVYVPTNRPISTVSSHCDDVFAPGDFVGEGNHLQGEEIRLVSTAAVVPHRQEPAKEFQVVRRLGTGSYAVVYLVREVLYRPLPSEDGHSSLLGSMDLDGQFGTPPIEYGRNFAIKCLSKANLDEEALAAQMSEVRSFISS
jgi:hypothetical protein